MQVLFRNYPKIFPFAGVLILFLAAILPDKAWQAALMIAIGIALLGFASVLTVAVDQKNRTLYLRYRSLFRRSTIVYPLSEICFVNVVEDSEGEGTYRIELALWSGKTVPLTDEFSGGLNSTERRARQIEALLKPSSSPPVRGRIARRYYEDR